MTLTFNQCCPIIFGLEGAFVGYVFVKIHNHIVNSVGDINPKMEKKMLFFFIVRYTCDLEKWSPLVKVNLCHIILKVYTLAT